MIESKHLPYNLLPCAKDVCQECAVDHQADLPHNRGSLFYQYHFYNEHGRWPTWEDAMAHCSEAMKKHWVEALAKKGVSEGWERRK